MNFSGNPWDVLELDRAQAGEREVKRAYARLLKTHRPDVDPEGFRRVNEAYQAALAELARGAQMVPEMPESGPLDHLESGSGFTAEVPPEAEPPRPAREVNPAVLAPFEEIRGNLIRRLGMVRGIADFPELTRLRNLVRQHPELAGPWVKLLMALVEGPLLEQVLTCLHPEDVWLLMREGQGSFAAGVMSHWRDDPRLLGRLTLLGNLLLELTGARDDPDRLQAMHFTARMAAFYLPQISGQLADELFQQTGPGVREGIVRDIEMRSAAGKLFNQLGLPHRRFWERQLFETDGDATVDWSEPERQAALREVAAANPPDWEGWPVVTQIVPETVLRPVLAQHRQRAARPVYATELAEDKPWHRFFSGRIWIFLLVLGVKILALSTSSHHSSPPPSDAWREKIPSFSSRPSAADEAQRKLDEILKKRTPDSWSPDASLLDSSTKFKRSGTPDPGQSQGSATLPLIETTPPSPDTSLRFDR